jgi:hypothetical protein
MVIVWGVIPGCSRYAAGLKEWCGAVAAASESGRNLA